MAGANEASLADLTTQLAHLKWRKCVNDAKIQNKIASSRALAERDLLVQLSENRAAARAKWRSSVIASELTRPLEIDEHFLRELEDEGKREAHKHQLHSEIHTRAIAKLERNVAERERTGLKGKTRTSTAHVRSNLAALQERAVELGVTSLDGSGGARSLGNPGSVDSLRSANSRATGQR